MTIRYQPKNVLKRMAAKKNVKNLLNKDLSVKKAALKSIATSGIVGQEKLEEVALRVAKSYRERVDKMRAEQGYTKVEATQELLKDPKLLIQQVQNETVAEITKAVQKQYHGAWYTWLPSTAKVPDLKHMKKYGKKYRIGKGEKPGDRHGCQCGMEIHVKESRLVLKGG